MLARYFEAGGPVMYAVLGAWIVVLAGVLDRLLYAAGRVARQPQREIMKLANAGDVAGARECLSTERRRAWRGTRRIGAVSQIATSLGLFGTVLGISQSFFSRGDELSLAAPEVMTAGLATALFTTVAGLIVFLFGQGFLIAFGEWIDFCERDMQSLGEEAS